jgi:hypothetical protein
MSALRRVFLTAALLALIASPALAQDEELRISVRKNFGFNAGSRIQGSFRLEATGPADLVSVTFLVDGQPIGTVSQPPFRLDFRTEDYALGSHELGAVGETAGGRALTATPRTFEFVSAAAGWDLTMSFMVPLLVIVGLVMLLGLGVPFVQSMRGQRQSVPPGTERNYGLVGGAICPKCGRPTPRHLWGLNMLVGKFDRCENCGRWSLLRAAPLSELRAAEAAERRQARAAARGSAPDASPEEQLRRQLDDSRFTE